MKKKIIYAICCLFILSTLASISSADPPPDQIVTVSGKVYNHFGEPIGGVTVTATNTATGNQTTNMNPVTAEEGYRINLANINGGWEVGETIVFQTSYTWLDITWTIEETLLMESDMSDTVHLPLNTTNSSIDNVTTEDLYILLLAMQDDIDTLQEDVTSMQENLSLLQDRMISIDDTTTTIGQRMGYAGTDPENTIYDDLTQLLMGLVYDIEENETRWKIDEVLNTQDENQVEVLAALGIIGDGNESNNGTGNNTGYISVSTLLEKLNILENMSADIISLNTRMFGKINTTINKNNNIINTLETTKTTTENIRDTVNNIGDNSDSIIAIEQSITEQNESFTSIEEQLAQQEKNIDNTQGAIGTITIIAIIIAIVVIGLLALVVKDYWEEITNEAR